MYINNNNYQENHKCENCRFSDICKWCGDMKMKQEEVLKIPLCKGLTPIRINITCRNFENKIQKQDGFAIR